MTEQPPLVDIEGIVRDVVANCELEGVTVDVEWRETLKRLATGEITADEAIRLTIERYQLDSQDDAEASHDSVE